MRKINVNINIKLIFTSPPASLIKKKDIFHNSRLLLCSISAVELRLKGLMHFLLIVSDVVFTALS